MPTCVTTYGGYEGVVGWIEELSCGDTPPKGEITVAVITGAGLDDLTSSGTYTGTQTKKDIRVEIDLAAGTDTFKWSNDDGVTWEATSIAITGAAQVLEEGISITFGATTGHTLGDLWNFDALTNELTGFGYVQNCEPTYGKGMQKGRQLNTQRLSWQREALLEIGLTVEYVPVDRVLDNIFKYALGASGTHDDHLPTRSIERGVERTSPAGEERELFNLSKVNTLTMETSVGEPWTFTEELVNQYMQHSTSKTYAGFQTLTAGIDPPLEADEPLMYYDNAIQISRYVSESQTGITGTSTTVASAPEDVDGSGSSVDDVRVFINGVEDVVVSVVTTTVTWTTAATAPDTVVINYYKPAENLADITDISIEMNRNQNPVRGIKAGIPVAYEFVEGAFEVTASLTQNFDNYNELQEMIDDNYVCLFVGIGSKTVRLLHGKFEGPPGPFTPEDLIAVSLDAEFEDVAYN